MTSAGRAQGSSEAKSYGRRASLLSIGVGITGLITYLYFAIASHELSREAYGQVAVLWSAVFIVVSVLQRPVEQLLSRTVSENLAHDTPIAHTVRIAATIQVSVAVVFDVLALALRGPIVDHRLRGELLRPRFPGRQPPADHLRAADHQRVGLADGLPFCGRARHSLGA